MQMSSLPRQNFNSTLQGILQQLINGNMVAKNNTWILWIRWRSF